jgi:hypothetical protein
MHRAFGYVAARTLHRRAAKLFDALDSTIKEDELPFQHNHLKTTIETTEKIHLQSNISSSYQSTFSCDSYSPW